MEPPTPVTDCQLPDLATPSVNDPVKQTFHKILKILGQFPFKQNPATENCVYETSILTWVWTLLVNLLYLIAVQPFVLFLIGNVFYFDFADSYPDQLLQQRLTMSFIFLICVSLLSSYICWFPTIKNIETCKSKLKCFKAKLYSYDSAYTKVSAKQGKIKDGRVKQTFIVATVCVCWIGIISFNAYSSFPVVQYVFDPGERDILGFEEFENVKRYFPPVIYLLIPDQTVAAMVVAVVISIISLPQIIGFVILYLLTEDLIGETECFHRRVKHYRCLEVSKAETVAFQVVGQETEPHKVAISLEDSQKPSYDMEAVQILELQQMAGDLRKISKVFGRASKWIVLVETTMAMTLGSVLIFYIVKWVGFSDVFNARQPHKAGTLFTFCFSAAKLLILVDCGEQCAKVTHKVQESVHWLCGSSRPSMRGIQHLKDTVFTINLQMSGCGFFSLRRTTLTSILGVIVTYLIVLVQFSSDTVVCSCESSQNTDVNLSLTTT